LQIQAALSHAKSPGLSGARPPTPMLTSIPTTTHVDTQPHKQPHACHSIVCRQSLLLCFSVAWLLGWCGPCLSAWWLGRGGRVATLQVSQPYCGVRSEKMVRGPMPAPSPWQPDAGCRHGNASECTHTQIHQHPVFCKHMDTNHTSNAGIKHEDKLLQGHAMDTCAAHMHGTSQPLMPRSASAHGASTTHPKRVGQRHTSFLAQAHIFKQAPQAAGLGILHGPPSHTEGARKHAQTRCPASPSGLF